MGIKFKKDRLYEIRQYGFVYFKVMVIPYGRRIFQYVTESEIEMAIERVKNLT